MHTDVCYGGNEVRLYEWLLSKQRQLQSASNLLGKVSKDKKGCSQLSPLPQCSLCVLPLPGQAIFLPAPSPSSPRAATEPGLLDGTKGAHSISPRCAALLQQPRLQHCLLLPPPVTGNHPFPSFSPNISLV